MSASCSQFIAWTQTCSWERFTKTSTEESTLRDTMKYTTDLSKSETTCFFQRWNTKLCKRWISKISLSLLQMSIFLLKLGRSAFGNSLLTSLRGWFKLRMILSNRFLLLKCPITLMTPKNSCWASFLEVKILPLKEVTQQFVSIAPGHLSQEPSTCTDLVTFINLR